MTSTRNVPVPVAGSRIWTKAWPGEVPFGIFSSLWRFAISPQVVVSARPSASPNFVRSSSSTERTMYETTGRGV